MYINTRGVEHGQEYGLGGALIWSQDIVLGCIEEASKTKKKNHGLGVESSNHGSNVGASSQPR
jgi:hypothetical protein